MARIAILLLLGSALAAGPAPGEADEDAALKKALRTYLDTATWPDRPALDEELFEKDILAFWSGGETHRGQEAVLGALERGNREFAEDFVRFGAGAEDVEIRRKGDLACLTCRVRLAGELTKERGMFERTIRSTFVFEKRDGRWRMAHEHSSRIPEK